MKSFVFPQDSTRDPQTNQLVRQGGMSLRDLFAAYALAGILCDGFQIKAMDQIARLSWEMADKMMVERERKA